MEQYLRRNRLSEFVDGLGVRVLIYALALGWFVWLWGLSAPALLAGAALGTLGQLVRTHFRKHTVQKREKALRCRIGAELLLEELLFAEPREAHFRAALLLESRWPLVMQSVKEDGVLCRQGDETLLVICIRMPAEGELSPGELIAAQRSIRRWQADRAVLCVLGRVSPKVAAKAEQTLLPLRLIPRETLLDIAGRLSPATDEQLVELGKRRRRSVGAGGVLELVFRRDKARKYFLYGVTMLVLYIITGAALYAVPGAVCLAMGVMCRSGRRDDERL
ncbi:MAG: hypothetical protein IJ438_12065 [Clostridia bacterium]|nr:hypothetical protein [Clostridia bacterium]